MFIDLFTFISSETTAEYAQLLYETTNYFKSGKHKINYKCILSNYKTAIIPNYKIVGRNGEYGHNSMNHGIALNNGLRYVNDKTIKKGLRYAKGRIAVFSDADIAILYPNWDEIVIQELYEHKCFGFNRPRENFPGVFFIAFTLPRLTLDFRPKIKNGKIHKYKITDATEAFIRNKKVGDIVKCDTGWKLPIAFNSNGASLNCILSKDKRRQLPFKDQKQMNKCWEKPEHMAEWHYKRKVFGTHKQACRNHPLSESWGAIWFDRINRYCKENFNKEFKI